MCLTLSFRKIIIRATHTQEVLGEKGRRIRELTALVQKRFKFPDNSLELYAEKVQYRGLSAIAQCESLRYKLLGGLAVRRYVSITILFSRKNPANSRFLVLAMVSSVSSWSLVPRVVKLSFPASFVLLVPSP